MGAEDVGESFARTAEHRRWLLALDRMQLVGTHRQQTGEYGEKADGVEDEAHPGAGRGDHDPGQSRADDARHVEEARVERDRIRQLVAPDHLVRERLPARCVEDLGGAEQHGQDVDDRQRG